MAVPLPVYVSPLPIYLAGELILLVMVRFAPLPGGDLFVLAGFLAIGFVGALVFRERHLENSKALIVSSGIAFGLVWLYVFGNLTVNAIANPSIVDPVVLESLRDNAAGSLFGAALSILAVICTSWMVCALLAIVGNIFGRKVSRLLRLVREGPLN